MSSILRVCVIGLPVECHSERGLRRPPPAAASPQAASRGDDGVESRLTVSLLALEGIRRANASRRLISGLFSPWMTF